jgi:hypothetical protein
MRISLSIVLVVLLAASALAGQNPECKVYVDFDPPNMVHRVDPLPYTVVTAYFGIIDFTAYSSISLRVSFDHEPLPVATYTAHCPGSLPIIIDDPEFGVILSCPECVYGAQYYFLSYEFFYVGGEADVMILDHWTLPREVLGCEAPPQVDHYCVLSHGAIGKEPEPGDPDCVLSTPTNTTAWGTIKALYR